MKILVAAALVAVAGTAAIASGRASEDGARVTVWGASGSRATARIDLVDALTRAPDIAAPDPAPFYTLEIDSGKQGGRLFVFYAPAAGSVAGNADDGGLRWLRLDPTTDARLADVIRVLMPYQGPSWPIGLKAGPLSKELAAATRGR